MARLEQARHMSAEDVAQLLDKNAAYELDIVERDRRIDELKAQLDWLTRQLFGQKSEKQIFPDTSTQPTLGEGMLSAAVAPESKLTLVPEHRRRLPKQPSREAGDPLLRFDESVPVEEIVILDDALEGVDPSSYSIVDFKRSYRLVQSPKIYKIVLVKRPVVKMKESGRFICPPIPASVFEGSFADASFLAGLVLDKLRYHLPLYRQHQRLLASGIHVDRSTLTRYVQRLAELLRPIYQAQKRSILTSRVLAIDETPIKAGRAAKGKMRQAYLWPVMGEESEIIFHYAKHRARVVLDQLLLGFSGTLLNDGYVAYESFCKSTDGVLRAQCWVHARRQFVKAESSEPELVREALARIAELYQLEATLSAEAKAAEIQQLRTTKSRPLVETFFEWLRQCLDERALLPSSPFTKAAQYSLERKTAMEVFLEDPRVAIDTNHLEREIRPIALGRKNWLFCWTELGAEQLGILQSLISTCRLQEVDPYRYLVDVMQRVAIHPAADVAQLTPRLWKELFAADPLPSLAEMPREERHASSVEISVG